MQRRTFLRDAALGAVAVSASGFISFNGTKYIGDCETTTDILGPFYRPGSPVRTNLVIPGEPGTKLLLSGKIKHDDCITPFKKAKVEIWHCSAKGVYDNDTDEFRYRATTFTDDEGKYSFQTILPVPYSTGGDNYRPAHYHLMISAEGYQPLITQLYFTGDPYLSKDPSSASPTAKRRILNLETLKDESKKVDFDVSLAKRLDAEVAAMDKLQGVYTFENSDRKVEFFRNGNQLWMKNEVYGINLEYVGDNSFRYPLGEEKDLYRFELQPGGKIRLEEIKSPATLTAYKN
jgi:protocatechuate 3,4-dioxygenase beta subunit